MIFKFHNISQFYRSGSWKAFDFYFMFYWRIIINQIQSTVIFSISQKKKKKFTNVPNE